MAKKNYRRETFKSKEEWKKAFADLETENSYILVAMLGNMSEERQNYIQSIADENKLNIIDIFGKGNICGPDKVLSLISNANLVFTDSFHFTAFSINFKTPFIVCEREEDSIDAATFSRIDSLLKEFSLSDRKYGQTTDVLSCDFENAHLTLEKDRKKFYDFIEKSLNIQ